MAVVTDANSEHGWTKKCGLSEMRFKEGRGSVRVRFLTHNIPGYKRMMGNLCENFGLDRCPDDRVPSNARWPPAPCLVARTLATAVSVLKESEVWRMKMQDKAKYKQHTQRIKDARAHALRPLSPKKPSKKLSAELALQLALEAKLTKGEEQEDEEEEEQEEEEEEEAQEEEEEEEEEPPAKKARCAPAAVKEPSYGFEDEEEDTVLEDAAPVLIVAAEDDEWDDEVDESVAVQLALEATMTSSETSCDFPCC